MMGYMLEKDLVNALTDIMSIHMGLLSGAATSFFPLLMLDACAAHCVLVISPSVRIFSLRLTASMSFLLGEATISAKLS